MHFQIIKYHVMYIYIYISLYISLQLLTVHCVIEQSKKKGYQYFI